MGVRCIKNIVMYHFSDVDVVLRVSSYSEKERLRNELTGTSASETRLKQD